MISRFVGIVFFAFVATHAAASGLSEDDTLVSVAGRVLDKTSNQPVKATIYYEKLPYGNDLGIIDADDSSGNFQFMIFPNSRYKIYVKARNYFAVVDKIEPGDCDGVNRIARDFYLRPLKEGELIRLENLFFEQGKFEIHQESYPELDLLASMLRDNPQIVIQLEGHTDFRGNKKLNLKLSLERVNTVKDYLVSSGIHRKRIKVKAFGGSSPLTWEHSEAARKMNRRVEIRILNL